MARARLRRVGDHAMVAVCPWTARSISDSKPCYKQQFYGFSSHRCLQMTPWSLGCQQHCVHCWRRPEGVAKRVFILPPEELFARVVEAHRQLVVGFKGNPRSDSRKAAEVLEPTNVTFSLTGEACLYPHLDSLLGVFKENGLAVVLVTAGAGAERLLSISNHPPMVYTSLCAYDASSYETLCRPDGPNWDNVLTFLRCQSSLSSTRVIRVTLIRGINNHAWRSFGDLIALASPDYVEVRSFSPVGEAAALGRDRVLELQECIDFSEGICRIANLAVTATNRTSRVVLMKPRIERWGRAVELLPTPA